MSPTITIYPLTKGFSPSVGEIYKATAGYSFPNSREVLLHVEVVAAGKTLREAASAVCDHVFRAAEKASEETQALRRRSTDV